MSSVEQRRGSRMKKRRSLELLERKLREADTNKNRNSEDPAAVLELTPIQLIPHNLQNGGDQILSVLQQ